MRVAQVLTNDQQEKLTRQQRRDQERRYQKAASYGGDCMSIDEALKTIRKELNISQETLARDLNVSFATLNRWENSKAKQSRLAMIQLKDYCANKGISDEIVAKLDRIK